MEVVITAFAAIAYILIGWSVTGLLALRISIWLYGEDTREYLQILPMWFAALTTAGWPLTAGYLVATHILGEATMRKVLGILGYVALLPIRLFVSLPLLGLELLVHRHYVRVSREQEPKHPLSKHGE